MTSEPWTDWGKKDQFGTFTNAFMVTSEPKRDGQVKSFLKNIILDLLVRIWSNLDQILHPVMLLIKNENLVRMKISGNCAVSLFLEVHHLSSEAAKPGL